MDFIQLTHENLAREHVCCAISKEDDVQVSSKKGWLKERLDEGLVFLKADVRGKCFIEYIPAENAWVPIEAPDFTFIDCLWVSGQYKGHGYSSLLLERCIADSRAKGKKGLVALSSKKKSGFLSDPKYLRHKGFEVCDTASPYFELLYLPFDRTAEKPQFKPHAKNPTSPESGFVIYYTSQCPFTAKYVPLLEKVAGDCGAKITTVHIQSRQEAQNAPVPFTTFSIFHDGEFLTHEIQSEKKFHKMIQERSN